MNVAREDHTATLLASGKVLVAGGNDGNQPSVTALASAELYDPSTGKWSFTGSSNVARFSQTAMPLTSGKVLIAVGDDGAGDCCAASQNSMERKIILNNTGKETQQRFGNLPEIPLSPCFCPHALASAELFDPSTGKWSLTGSLNTARELDAGTRLANGQALVAGGINCDILNQTCTIFTSAELYDSTKGKWSLT